MFKIILALVSCFITLSIAAQQPVLQWAKAFHSNNVSNFSTNSNGRTIGVDAQGNVYSAGLFKHSIDFDPGPEVFTVESAGKFNTSIFISKLDANGNFVWAKQIPTYVEFGQIEMEVDRAGNIYLTSDLNEPADMDPGPGVLIMTPTGFRDAFVVKLNSNGNLVWAKQFGGPGDTGPQGLSVAIDKEGNVIVGGIFNNTVDFDPGPATLNITSTAHMQSYIVKLNPAGDLLWAKQFGNGPVAHADSYMTDIKCDERGDILLTGSFNGTCDFDPGPNVFNVKASEGTARDGYIARLKGNGDFVWVKTFGQTGFNNHFMTPTGIHIDGMNNIITAGYFIGDFDFDPGLGVQRIYGNPFQSFILKLDAQGNFKWVKVIGGDEQDTGHDVAIDSDNNVYTIGVYGPTVDFDPGADTHMVTSPHYGPSGVIKLSPGGDFVYAALFQSISWGTSLFRRMVVDPAHNIYVAGYISGINDFDPGPAVFPLSSGSNSAPFVMKLGRCLNATSSTLTISACNDFVLNNQTYDSSGTYVQIVPNSAGCDSVITLNLRVNKKRTEQNKTICSGESFFAGGAKQTAGGTYYDTLYTAQGCDSIVTTHLAVNPVPVPDLGRDSNLCRNDRLTLSPGDFTGYLWQDNSTASSFTVTAAGQYWVRVTNSFNCVATDTFMVAQMMEPPSNFLKKSDSICSYGSIELLPLQSYASYRWSTGATAKSIQVKTPGLYQLTATDANGCTGTDSTTIILKQCMLGLYVPTGFTPNSDGRNDLLRPLVFGKWTQFRFAVYNRWGTVVFQSTDPQKGWDGKIGGVLQNDAVFVWVCSYQLEGMPPKTEKGSVMLLH
jgi:gliding motility-associated-like protein